MSASGDVHPQKLGSDVALLAALNRLRLSHGGGAWINYSEHAWVNRKVIGYPIVMHGLFCVKSLRSLKAKRYLLLTRDVSERIQMSTNAPE